MFNAVRPARRGAGAAEGARRHPPRRAPRSVRSPAAPCQLEPHPPPPQDEDDPQEDEELQEDEEPHEDDPPEQELDEPEDPLPAHQLDELPDPWDPEAAVLPAARTARIVRVTTKAMTKSPITMKTNVMSAPSLTPRSSRGSGIPASRVPGGCPRATRTKAHLSKSRG